MRGDSEFPSLYSSEIHVEQFQALIDQQETTSLRTCRHASRASLLYTADLSIPEPLTAEFLCRLLPATAQRPKIEIQLEIAHDIDAFDLSRSDEFVFLLDNSDEKVSFGIVKQ